MCETVFQGKIDKCCIVINHQTQLMEPIIVWSKEVSTLLATPNNLIDKSISQANKDGRSSEGNNEDLKIFSKNTNAPKNNPAKSTPKRAATQNRVHSILLKRSVEDESIAKDTATLIDIQTGNFPNNIINIGKDGVKLNKITPQLI